MKSKNHNQLLIFDKLEITQKYYLFVQDYLEGRKLNRSSMKSSNLKKLPPAKKKEYLKFLHSLQSRYRLLFLFRICSFVIIWKIFCVLINQ